MVFLRRSLSRVEFSEWEGVYMVTKQLAEDSRCSNLEAFYIVLLCAIGFSHFRVLLSEKANKPI